MNRESIDRVGVPAVLAAMYAVGVVGHLAQPLRGLMLRLTPFVLAGLGLLVFARSLLAVPRELRPRMLVWALATYAATFAVEAAGVATGAVFGSYAYGATLGVAVSGVPLVIGFNWLLVVLGAVRVAEEVERVRPDAAALVPLAAGLLTVAFDWVMEPVAMALDYWQWEGGRIPLQNYAAWFFVATTAAMAYRRARIRSESRLPAVYLVVQLAFFVILRLSL